MFTRIEWNDLLQNILCDLKYLLFGTNRIHRFQEFQNFSLLRDSKLCCVRGRWWKLFGWRLPVMNLLVTMDFGQFCVCCLLEIFLVIRYLANCFWVCMQLSCDHYLDGRDVVERLVGFSVFENIRKRQRQRLRQRLKKMQRLRQIETKTKIQAETQTVTET